uniref:DNA-directed RNA polymerase subunit beta n=1 Tax=Lepocinclis tripteris TaxID=135494 RepID=A0A3G3LKW0_9EUGL|nr:RNA polymerase beta subunit [Lepocinclis tripteris]AYQ93346.1 RNA polymerase beta subunit [Lepocinclis tripteris]
MQIKSITTDPIELQIESFKDFLKKETYEENLYLKFINNKYFKLTFNSQNLKFKLPLTNVEECILKNKTYSLKVYINLTIKKTNKNILLNKYVLLTEIPLITKNGNFIINGNPRIMVQSVRSTGIFTYEDKKIQGNLLTTIIPKKGSWVTLKINSDDNIYFKLGKTNKKLSALKVLQDLGLTRKKIFYSLKNIKFLKNLTQNKEKKRININKLKFFKKTQQKNYSIKYKIEWLIMSIKDYFDLGKTGREKINKKIYKKNNYLLSKRLKAEDLLGCINNLINLKNGIGEKDNIDSLANKRIILIGEILNNQILNNLNKLIENLKSRLKLLTRKIIYNKKNIKNFQIKEFLNSQIISVSLKKLFTSNLSQIMEETNPMSEITHKRKIYSLTGSKKRDSNLVVREVTPTYFGKICPIETVEGKNAGLIWSLAKEARINKDGFIETPFYLIRFVKTKTKINLNKAFIFLSSKQEKMQKSLKVKKSNIFIMPISRIQMLSLGTATIPFLEHNDANRVLMGSNMQRQTIPVIKKESPILSTGIDTIIIKNNDYNIKAKYSGLIKYIDTKKIIIYEKLKKNTGKIVSFNNSSFYKAKNLQTKKIQINNKKIYLLKKRFSNQNNFIQMKPIVKENNYIVKGEIITDSIYSKKGKLSLGKNLLIAYMPWKGYNFEDAVIINKRLIDEDILSSIYIKKYKTFILNNDTGKEKITKKIPKTKREEKYNLNNNGIIKEGIFLNKGNIIVGKIKQATQNNYKNKILNLIFKKRRVKDVSLRTSGDHQGKVIEIRIIKNKFVSIIIYIAEKRKIQIGDKISGRHGNKGIISKFLEQENMPYLQDGKIIDIILNPLGIPSRMNVGQLFECLLGLAGKNLKENYQIIPFDEVFKNETSKIIVYNKLYEASKKTNKKWIFNPNNVGKTLVFNGKTGKPYLQKVTVGYSYILKLIHQVKDKIAARSTGSYSVITKQPLRGKSKKGGQRFGEMEIWALESFGCAYTLQEIITIKSDDTTNKFKLLYNLIKGALLPEPGIPESSKLFILELESICIKISISKKSSHKNLFN